MFVKVLKANPYRDENGRFSSEGKAKQATLTEAETGAARTYSQSGYDYSYGYVNGFLRTGTMPKSGNMDEATMKSAVKDLDSAISKSTLGKDTTVYRGTSLAEYGLKAADMKPGVVLKDKAYTSTTTDLDVATGGYSSRDSVTLKMTVPKDAPALDMAEERDGKALGEITSEAEVLLPRGMSFKVKSVTGSGRDTIVEVEPTFPSNKAKKSIAMQSIAGDGDQAMLQVVYGEVYAPNRLDAHNEYMTAEEIRKAAWAFAKKGITQRIDVQHDNKVLGQVEVVESFIARDDDPDFIPGSWVVGVHIEDAAIWDRVMSGELNGFSMEALVRRSDKEVELEFPDHLSGSTTMDEGHSHAFTIYYDENGMLKGGVTDEVNGHVHQIIAGTVTEYSGGPSKSHRHGFSAVDGLEFLSLSEAE